VPEVRLGTLADGGLAPAIMAIVERGVTRRRCGSAARCRTWWRCSWRRCWAECRTRWTSAAARHGMFASRRVRIQGGLGPMRSFLGVIRL
jgi:hypothetical protein